MFPVDVVTVADLLYVFEECKALGMLIRIGNANGQLLHVDHNYMRVGGADVILDHQSTTRSGGSEKEYFIRSFAASASLRPAAGCITVSPIAARICVFI
jgi:hypothetical protein